MVLYFDNHESFFEGLSNAEELEGNIENLFGRPEVI